MREVYTDGACQNNPGGPGGWGWVVDETTYDYGGDPSTTNQRMEIRAVLEAMVALSGPLLVVTDSKYVINCATGKWKRKANTDLWEPFMAAKAGRQIKFKWVKGHSGVRLNEVADRLAYVGMTGDLDVLSGKKELRAPKFVVTSTWANTCSNCGDRYAEGTSVTKVEGLWVHAECFVL